jgi:hypothetical protein
VLRSQLADNRLARFFGHPTFHLILSWKGREKLLSHTVAVENFDIGNRVCHDINYQHSFGWFQHQASMAGTIGSFRLGLCVKRRAEVISAPATIYNRQSRDLGSQLTFSFLMEKLFKFMC